jgi:DNA-binding NarL/FixJ family response regulator
MIRVYIVEDESLLRDFMKDLLTGRNDFALAGAGGDAETALAECLRLKPDMVVTDVRLPGMDGVELSLRLREGLPDIRILLVSGAFSPAIIRRALMSKVSGIVEKSAGLAEMEKALTAVAAGQSYYGDAILKSLPELLSGNIEPHPVEALTSREKEILCMIADGLSTREIADKLKISARTADVHRMHIMTKLDAHNVASLTRIAIASGLVDISIM